MSLHMFRNAIGDHFAALFNKSHIPTIMLNWEMLFPDNIPNVESIEGPFTELEIMESVSLCLVTNPQDFMDSH